MSYSLIHIPGVPGRERWLPSLLLSIIGVLMKIIIDLVKHFLRPKIEDRGVVIQTVTKVILIYNDALFGVVFWVGGFNILYTGFPPMLWHQLLAVLLLSAASLFLMGAFQCTAGVPTTIITDTNNNVFSPESYFRASVAGEEGVTWTKVLDTVFTYTVIHSLVICSWWSVWELENNYILQPCEIIIKDFKAWDSIVIAFMLAPVIFSIDTSVRDYSRDNADSCWRPLVVGAVSVAAFLASLNFWRGVWSLMDFYFFPSMNVEENLLLSHGIGFVWSVVAGTGLTLTQSSRRDPEPPEYNQCRYWSLAQAQPGATEQPTEESPLVLRNL